MSYMELPSFLRLILEVANAKSGYLKGMNGRRCSRPRVASMSGWSCHLA